MRSDGRIRVLFSYIFPYSPRYHLYMRNEVRPKSRRKRVLYRGYIESIRHLPPSKTIRRGGDLLLSSGKMPERRASWHPWQIQPTAIAPTAVLRFSSSSLFNFQVPITHTHTYTQQSNKNAEWHVASLPESAKALATFPLSLSPPLSFTLRSFAFATLSHR